MQATTGTNIAAVHVDISDDHMSASFSVDPALAPHGVDLATLMSALQSASVVVPPELLSKISGGNRRFQTANGPIVISHGIPPTLGTPPRLVLLDDLRPLPATGPVPLAAPQVPLARIEGGAAGADGRDVCGKRVASQTPAPDFILGAGVVLAPDRTVHARVEGRLSLTLTGVLRILPLVDFEGDLDSHSELRELGGDLRVAGALREHVVLKVDGSLAVANAVEAFRLDVGEDLTIGGGLLGREHGTYTAGRNITCHFATAAELKAGGNLKVETDMLHCRASCHGELQVGERISGSTVVATAGIRCRSASNTNRSQSILEAGTDPDLKVLAANALPKVQGHIQRLEHGRLTIEPLMQRRDVLTPAQKQQALRLAQENERLEHEIHQMTAGFRAHYARTQATAQAIVHVQDILGAGVIIRFAGMEAVIPTAMRGPLSLRPSSADGEPRMIVTDLRSGTITYIPARHITDAVALQLKKVMSKVA